MAPQTQNDEILRRLATEIAAAAQPIVEKAAHGETDISIAPLRRLHEQSERFLHVATSTRTRFLLFVLSATLQEVFYNLSGDVPYGPKSHERRQRFFVTLAENLRKFGSAIVDGDHVSALDLCEKTISSYFDAITDINNLLDEQE